MRKLLFMAIAIFITTSSFSQTKISVDSAIANIGKEVTVCSKVYGVKSFDRLTLLYLGATYPNPVLTIAIFKKDSANFKIPFDTYNNKTVCVTGTLAEFKGKPEIVLTKESEIQVDPVDK